MRLNIRILTVVALSLLGTLSFATKRELPQHEKLVKGNLPNGLTYYIMPNDNPKGEAIYRLFIKSGSLYEREDQRGLAHFLEHMAFNGSKDFPNGSLVGYLQSKGAGFGSDINAHTAMHETVYKLRLPTREASFVDTTIMVLANWAGHLSLDSAAIEKERGIIISEWLTKAGPERVVSEAFLMELLNNSRYSKRMTIGDTAVIKNFSHDKLRDYYHNWYNPSLMAVAVSGDVDPTQVENSIKLHFAPLESPKIKLDNYPISNYKEPAFTAMGNSSIKKIEFSTLQLSDIPAPISDVASYKEYLLRTLVNRLFAERFSAHSYNSPAYSSASIATSSLLNTKGILSGNIVLKPTRVMEGIREFAIQSEQVYRHGFLSSEIEKVKRGYTSSMRRGSESTKSRESISLMDNLYASFYRGSSVISVKQEYDLMLQYIDKIDSAMIIKYLRKLRKPSQTHYFLKYNDKVAAEVPDNATVLSLIDSISKAKTPTYDKYIKTPVELLPNLPSAKKAISKENIEAINGYQIRFANGIKVTYKQSDVDKDRIAISAFRRGGLSALDSTEYVSGLFSNSVVPLSGAGDFSREQLSYFLAGSSASARLIIEKNRAGLIAGANNDEMEQMFQLIYLKWCFPRMDTAVLAQAKKNVIHSYRNSIKTPADKFNRELGLLVSGSDYTNRQLSDTVINTELDEQKLIPIFNRSFGSAQGFEFIVVSNLPVDDVMPMLETYIGSLPAGESDQAYRYKGGAIPLRDTALIKQVGSDPKAVVSLYFQNNAPISKLGHQEIICDIAKAVTRTKLIKSLREQLNKVYSVGVSAGAISLPNALNRVAVSFSCNPADVDTLINRTLADLKEMVDNPSSMNADLSDVKLNMNKGWNAERQKSLYWSSGIRNVLYRGDSDWEIIVNYENILSNITSKDIAEYIRLQVVDRPLIKAVLLPAEGVIVEK